LLNHLPHTTTNTQEVSTVAAVWVLWHRLMWWSFALFTISFDLSFGYSDLYACKKEFSEIGRKDFHFRGTALGKHIVTSLIELQRGGWLVLEPWITPSLFYQFLGAKSVSI
jgi:hypothetical protein